MPASEPMRVWHLLTHTAGLTYGFHHAHAVDEIYRAKGFEFAAPRGMDLAAACDAWAAMPLLFQPGAEWNYSVATDVLGRVVEVVSGQRLDTFLAEHVLAPLGMTTLRSRVAPDDLDRLAGLYMPNPAGGLLRNTSMGDAATRAPTFLSGGGGLVSTAADYHRFTQMLARGGELDGARLLGTRTVAYMTRNHLPGGADLETFGRPIFAESAIRGIGFGLGVSVVVDAAAGKMLTQRRRVRLGRAGQHRLLRRPGRGGHRDVLHPAAARRARIRSGPSCARWSTRRWWTDPDVQRARTRHPGGRDRGQPVGGHADRPRHRIHGAAARPAASAR